MSANRKELLAGSPSSGIAFSMVVPVCAIAMLAVLALACENRTDAGDSDAGGAVLPDVMNDADTSGRVGDEYDVFMVDGDAPSLHADADVITHPHDATHEGDPALRDVASADGDGARCACIEFDAGSRHHTTSLECFGDLGSAFAVYVQDPCVGLRAIPPIGAYWGWRIWTTYADHNLIGVRTGGQDGPTHEYFFDATTKEMVGAARTAGWNGRDSIYCNLQPGSQMFSVYTTVRAGRLPDCAITDWGINCTPSSSQQICPPPEAGVPDGGPDDAAGADAPDGVEGDASDVAAPDGADMDAATADGAD
jgi:hypothetical protein